MKSQKIYVDTLICVVCSFISNLSMVMKELIPEWKIFGGLDISIEEGAIERIKTLIIRPKNWNPDFNISIRIEESNEEWRIFEGVIWCPYEEYRGISFNAEATAFFPVRIWTYNSDIKGLEFNKAAKKLGK